MAKKDVSAVVSGMGLAMSIVTALVEKARKLGCSDEDIHRLATPDGETVLEKMAELMVQAKKAVENIFRLLVNYDLKVEAMVKEGKYDWKNNDINAKNFPTERAGQCEIELKLFHFNKAMTSEDVIKEMDKQGYRPAELSELLALGAKHPDEQRKYPIIALGSVWRYWYGSRGVAYLRLDDSGRELRLYCFDDGWHEDCRFAAVRK